MCELGPPILGYIFTLHLNILKTEMIHLQYEKGRKAMAWTARKTCVSLVLHFVCFVFASVFISDEEPGRVCQAPVSMQAIISARFEVCACV